MLLNLKQMKFPSNHTEENLVILDKITNILFLGDALAGKIVDYDFIKDKEVIKEQIEFLNNLNFETAIESHSKPISKTELIKKLNSKLK